MSKLWRLLLGWLFILGTNYLAMILFGLFIEANTETVVAFSFLLLVPFLIWYVKVDTDMKLLRISQQIAQLQSTESE